MSWEDALSTLELPRCFWGQQMWKSGPGPSEANTRGGTDQSQRWGGGPEGQGARKMIRCLKSGAVPPVTESPAQPVLCCGFEPGGEGLRG